MDSIVQNLQTLQRHAGLSMERGLHSVLAGNIEHACLFWGW